MTKEALKSAIEFAEYCLEELDLSHMASNQAKRLVQKSKEALAKPEQERCVGCEACIDTACGRDECPKGWPKAAQPEQEPVEWGVDWGPDGNSVSIIKRLADGNIEVLAWEYAPHPPQRKPLTYEQIINEADRFDWDKDCAVRFARAIEAAHGITASEAEDSHQRSKT